VRAKSAAEREEDREREEADKLELQKEAQQRKADIFSGTTLPSELQEEERNKERRRETARLLRGLGFVALSSSNTGDNDKVSVVVVVVVDCSLVRLIIAFGGCHTLSTLFFVYCSFRNLFLMCLLFFCLLLFIDCYDLIYTLLYFLFSLFVIDDYTILL
jgi:hypothetical protein